MSQKFQPPFLSDVIYGLSRTWLSLKSDEKMWSRMMLLSELTGRYLRTTASPKVTDCPTTTNYKESKIKFKLLSKSRLWSFSNFFNLELSRVLLSWSKAYASHAWSYMGYFNLHAYNHLLHNFTIIEHCVQHMPTYTFTRVLEEQLASF